MGRAGSSPKFTISSANAAKPVSANTWKVTRGGHGVNNVYLWTRKARPSPAIGLRSVTALQAMPAPGQCAQTSSHADPAASQSCPPGHPGYLCNVKDFVILSEHLWLE
jgi:hypothetical protein